MDIINNNTDSFGTDFTENKRILNKISIVRSKGLKNQIDNIEFYDPNGVINSGNVYNPNLTWLDLSNNNFSNMLSNSAISEFVIFFLVIFICPP